MSLDGEVIDNPLPETHDAITDMSAVSQTFAQVELEVSEHNRQVDQRLHPQTEV